MKIGKAFEAANALSDSVYEATEKVDDPYFIHTNTYDSIQDISLQVYNRLFNEELCLGGWENINIAHYWNIEKALEKYRYQGKRVLDYLWSWTQRLVFKRAIEA